MQELKTTKGDLVDAKKRLEEQVSEDDKKLQAEADKVQQELAALDRRHTVLQQDHDAAVQESLDSIGTALNENGKVIVTGCLGKRADLIREAYPDVLSISGPQDYASVMHAVHDVLPPKRNKFLDIVPDTGVKLTPKHYAYLKISEGCNNRCTFCIIPKLRGDLVSRTADDVLREAEKLAMGGVKELLVISQDTSAYGVDVKYAEHEWHGKAYRTRMTELCEGLSELGVWVRLHYVYPYPHVD